MQRRDTPLPTSAYFERVLHEVGDDLPEPVGIDVGGRGIAAAHAEVEPSSCGLRRERHRRVAHDVAASHGRGRQGELVAVEPREVEQVADEPFEPRASA